MEKKIIYSLLILITLSTFIVSAQATYYEKNITDVSSLDSNYITATKLRYEPYPVSPGDYFKIYIQVEKTGTTNKNVEFQLLPEYPFSLDPNENPIRKFTNLGNEPVVLEYQVRVSDSAVSGVNKLKLMQKSEGIGGDITNEFDINIMDVQTAFDAVIQDNQNGAITIALANTGQNNANAAIVKIPAQEGIKVLGSNGQMIGNLDQGDYTVVSFNLGGISKNLLLEIDYTDAIGIRRNRTIEVPFSDNQGGNFTGNSTRYAGLRSGNRTSTSTNASSNSTFGNILILLIVIIAVYFGIKYGNKSKQKKTNSNVTPDWVTKERSSKK